jgi:hypothetical protein
MKIIDSKINMLLGNNWGIKLHAYSFSIISSRSTCDISLAQAVTVTLTVAVSVTVSFSVVVTVRVNSCPGAIGVMINGPSDVGDGAAEEADGAGGGCALDVVDEETRGGDDGATAEDGCAGASGAGDEIVGCAVVDSAGLGGAAAADDDGCTAMDDTGELGTGIGIGVTGTFDASGSFVGDGAIVVYCVMMTTGGGTRGVGESIAGEEFEEDATGG